MARLPLRELEEALRNPVEYRKKTIEGHGIGPPMRPTFFSALRDAVFRYHRSGNKEKALEYLIERISAFKSDSKKQDVIAQFAWYIESFAKSGFVCVGTKVKINIAANDTLDLFGEVSRVDMNLSRGYAAWLLQNKKPGNWIGELRMPIIQKAVANIYGVTAQFVTMGVYFFNEMEVEQYCFSDGEITEALTRISILANDLNL